MLDKIQLLNSVSSLSYESSSCECDSGGGAFDMVMISLLKAVTSKSDGYGNYIINNVPGLITQSTIQTSNKIETSTDNEVTKERIDNAIKVSSQRYGVDETLIRAIIKVESNFNPNSESRAGAKGLMQLMPENCKAYNVTDPFNIEQNIDAGTRHIKEYIDKYNGNVEMALMAYNGGPTRMAKRGVTSISDIYKMPKETQNYVPKVMKYYKG